MSRTQCPVNPSKLYLTRVYSDGAQNVANYTNLQYAPPPPPTHTHTHTQTNTHTHTQTNTHTHKPHPHPDAQLMANLFRFIIKIHN